MGYRVSVIHRTGRRCYDLRYTDPITGKRRLMATDIEAVDRSSLRAAEAEADKLAKRLDDESLPPSGKFTWANFRSRYESEVVPSLAVETGVKVRVVLNRLETVIDRVRLSGIREEHLSKFAAALRTDGMSESTIKSYLATLRSALSWAVDQRMLESVPRIAKVRRARKGGKASLMRSRPITGEEFDRMLEAVPAVVGEECAEEWRRLLLGIWLSGLRIGEAVSLSWDRGEPVQAVVDRVAGAEAVLLKFDAAGHKSATDVEFLPPEPFVSLLLETPSNRRRGRVFKVMGTKGEPVGEKWASRIVAAIGRKARIVVSTKPVAKRGGGGRQETTKYASAHDLRRSFATRCAEAVGDATVSPHLLQAWMRHSTFQTTMDYYLAINTRKASEDHYRRALAARQPSQQKPAPARFRRKV